MAGSLYFQQSWLNFSSKTGSIFQQSWLNVPAQGQGFTFITRTMTGFNFDTCTMASSICPIRGLTRSSNPITDRCQQQRLLVITEYTFNPTVEPTYKCLTKPSVRANLLPLIFAKQQILSKLSLFSTRAMKRRLNTIKLTQNQKKWYNSNFVQIPSKLPKYPEISLKIPKFLLSFSFISFSQSLRNLGLRPPIVCSLPLSFAFESLPKQNFVKYAGQ